MGNMPRVCRWVCAPAPAAMEPSLPPKQDFAMSTLVGSRCERPPCLPRTDMPQVLRSGLSCPPTPPTSITARLGFDIRFKVAVVPLLGCTGGATSRTHPSLRLLTPDIAHDSHKVGGLFRVHVFTHYCLLYLVHLFRETEGPVILLCDGGHIPCH